MTTLGKILDHAGLDALNVLDAQIDVPALAAVQAQGDLIILPRPMKRATTPIPAAGVTIVRAESAARNTHTLHSWVGPTCLWDFVDNGPADLILGVLTVPEGATAYLVHSEEHGANAMAPGSYEIRRQREMADTIRIVQD